jgi:hypothetical protein
MQQEMAVLTMVEEIIWESMKMMIHKNLVKPDFEKYLESFDPNQDYCPYGNSTALFHGLDPVPDKRIGLQAGICIS